jgi:lipopolysaccharide biosynthesis regulator YciM
MRKLLHKLSSLNLLSQNDSKKTAAVFAKLLDSHQETIETHLALGGLFRRRGELDKAVGIHQNLIAKPSLTAEQRSLSLLELSRDYMRAGVLDHAENILLDLVNQGSELEASLQHLMDIYQQSKDWASAIKAAEKLQETTKRDMSHQIAHYYCELAERHWLRGEQETAAEYVKKAEIADGQCVRVSLLLGNMAAQAKNYAGAIKMYKRIETQDPDFLSEIISPLARCYENLNNSEGMLEYLKEYLKKRPNISVVLAFADWLYKTKNEAEASNFVLSYLREYPSLLGLQCLIQFSVDKAEGTTKEELKLIQELIGKMLTNKPHYRCRACGFSTRTLQWQCPGCKRWDIVKPIHQ